MPPDLDVWLPRPQIRVRHRREVAADPGELWAAAQAVRLRDARRLGAMVRMRIPGLSPDLRFADMFRAAPFNVLVEEDQALVSGLVGRIWTIRRDYPRLSGPEEFRAWSTRGTVRVLFAHWVEPVGPERSALVSESRVKAVDTRGRLGLMAVRPLISSSHQLVSRDGIQAALRVLAARQGAPPPGPPDPDSVSGQAEGA